MAARRGAVAGSFLRSASTSLPSLSSAASMPARRSSMPLPGRRRGAGRGCRAARRAGRRRPRCPPAAGSATARGASAARGRPPTAGSARPSRPPGPGRPSRARRTRPARARWTSGLSSSCWANWPSASSPCFCSRSRSPSLASFSGVRSCVDLSRLDVGRCPANGTRRSRGPKLRPELEPYAVRGRPAGATCVPSADVRVFKSAPTAADVSVNASSWHGAAWVPGRQSVAVCTTRNMQVASCTPDRSPLVGSRRTRGAVGPDRVAGGEHHLS